MRFNVARAILYLFPGIEDHTKSVLTKEAVSANARMAGGERTPAGG